MQHVIGSAVWLDAYLDDCILVRLLPLYQRDGLISDAIPPDCQHLPDLGSQIKSLSPYVQLCQQLKMVHLHEDRHEIAAKHSYFEHQSPAMKR